MCTVAGRREGLFLKTSSLAVAALGRSCFDGPAIPPNHFAGIEDTGCQTSAVMGRWQSVAVREGKREAFTGVTQPLWDSLCRDGSQVLLNHGAYFCPLRE